MKLATNRLRGRSHGVVPGADAASFDRAAHEAERNCPVSRALQGNVEISI
jgi:osmotically inducible protein OsmC